MSFNISTYSDKDSRDKQRKDRVLASIKKGTAHPHIFTCAKIVCPQRSKVNTFGYNECDWYASADVYYITNPHKDYHIKYILGLLNSKLYFVWLYHKGKRKGETLELYQKPLSEIPIKRFHLISKIQLSR